MTAIPPLQHALRSPDPEVRQRGRRALGTLWETPDVRRFSRAAFLRRDLPEVEITSLALLCFLGAGYTHLSRDEYVDPIDSQRRYAYGKIVRRGLDWLLKKAESKGTFDAENPVGDAIATLAVLEAYGHTMSGFLKEPAERAADRMAHRERYDPRFSAWKALAIGSAIADEVPFGFRKDLDLLEESLAARTGSLGQSVGAILKVRRTRVRDHALAGQLVGSEGNQTPEEVLFATLAIYQTGGYDSYAWRTWAPQVRERLLSTRTPLANWCGDGAWEGASLEEELRTTAYQLLTLTVYYRYPGHLGAFGPPLREPGAAEVASEPH